MKLMNTGFNVRPMAGRKAKVSGSFEVSGEVERHVNVRVSTSRLSQSEVEVKVAAYGIEVSEVVEWKVGNVTSAASYHCHVLSLWCKEVAAAFPEQVLSYKMVACVPVEPGHSVYVLKESRFAAK